jgi:hypothetical protein
MSYRDQLQAIVDSGKGRSVAAIARSTLGLLDELGTIDTSDGAVVEQLQSVQDALANVVRDIQVAHEHCVAQDARIDELTTRVANLEVLVRNLKAQNSAHEQEIKGLRRIYLRMAAETVELEVLQRVMRERELRKAHIAGFGDFLEHLAEVEDEGKRSDLRATFDEARKALGIGELQMDALRAVHVSGSSGVHGRPPVDAATLRVIAQSEYPHRATHRSGSAVVVTVEQAAIVANLYASHCS